MSTFFAKKTREIVLVVKDSIGKYITTISRHLTLFINRKLETYNMTNGQYLFFVTICHHEGLCQDELSQMLKIDKITTSKMLKKLVEEGYVKKTRDPRDKRFCRLYLTEKGTATVPRVHEILDETTTILSEGLTEAEGQQVRALLRQMLNNIAQHNAAKVVSIT